MRGWAPRALALGLFSAGIAMTGYGVASLVLPGTELIPDRPSLVDVLTFSLTFVAFPTVGLLVAWRRPRHPIGWLFLVIGLGITTSVFATEYTDRFVYADADHAAIELVAWIGSWAWFLSAGLALTFAVLLFPTGRLPGPRWRPLAILAAIVLGTVVIADALRPGPVPGYEHVPLLKPIEVGGAIGEAMGAIADIGIFAILALGLACVASLALRFRRATGTERQQLKWFLYPISLLLAGLVVASIVQSSLAWTVALLGLAAVPIGAGIAILRHRLFDIDLVINRTLVYATLSVLLAAVYVGLILLLQALLSPLLGTESVAVALSTLAVAALFGPLRRRVQDVVDRRFYRSRYDAQRTLAGFAAGLRNEVDLAALTVELQRAAQRSLRPATTSVWLRDRHQ